MKHSESDEHHTIDTKHNGTQRKGNVLIAGLTSGHGVLHWYLQSLFVLLPEVEEAFNLTKVGVGSISTTRETVSGLITLPGGILADALRRYWGLILALCMGVFGIGWLIVGPVSYTHLTLPTSDLV